MLLGAAAQFGPRRPIYERDISPVNLGMRAMAADGVRGSGTVDSYDGKYGTSKWGNSWGNNGYGFDNKWSKAVLTSCEDRYAMDVSVLTYPMLRISRE